MKMLRIFLIFLILTSAAVLFSKSETFIVTYNENSIETYGITMSDSDYLIKQIGFFSEIFRNYPDTVSFLYDEQKNITYEKFINRYSKDGGVADYHRTAYFYTYNNDLLLSANCKYFDSGE